MCISSRGGTIPKGRSADLANVLHVCVLGSCAVVLHVATCECARALAGMICLPACTLFETMSVISVEKSYAIISG